MKNLLKLSVILLFLFGCQGNDSQQTDTIKLNNGEKWKVNTATQVGMQNMQDILSTDYNLDSVGFELADQTTYIINNCDMKGEAHDNLHIELHPMLKNIKVIKESDNENIKKESVEELSSLLKQYFEYFEE